MPYVILVGEDNSLCATKKERIMHRSKLVDTLWFLVAPEYNGYSMADCTVLMEYVLPCSKRYKTEILNLSKEGYKDHLKYTLPFDTELTAEHGQIELQLTFAMADIDDNGNTIQRVRKTKTCLINVHPIAAWSDLIPDDALTSLDQRIIKMDAQMKALGDYAEYIDMTKADNIKYNKKTSEIQLLSGDKEIGDAVMLDDVVVFLDDTPDPDPDPDPDPEQPGCGCGCNCGGDVVEFPEDTPCDCDEDVVVFS